jgi:hypothetical protein
MNFKYGLAGRHLFLQILHPPLYIHVGQVSQLTHFLLQKNQSDIPVWINK